MQKFTPAQIQKNQWVISLYNPFIEVLQEKNLVDDISGPWPLCSSGVEHFFNFIIRDMGYKYNVLEVF
jgi:hypothetical protein